MLFIYLKVKEIFPKGIITTCFENWSNRLQKPACESYRDLELVILPGKPTRHMGREDIYIEYVSFWKDFWITEMGKASGDNQFVNADDVLRQSAILLLRYQGQIVSALMTTQYDLHAPGTQYAKYFSHFGPASIQKLKSESAGFVSTMEFLAVHSDWRRSRLGISLGPLISDICFELAINLGADVHVGVCRTENKVNDLLFRFGGVSLERVKKVNIDCEIVAVFEPKRTVDKNPLIREAKNFLWERRLDLRNSTAAKIAA